VELSFDERQTSPRLLLIIKTPTDSTTLITQPVGAAVLRMIFEATKHTITATSSEHGAISPNGQLEIVEGGNQKFTFIPNMCYEIDEVKIDGINNPSAVAEGSYTFTNIDINHTIEVTFKPTNSTYTVTVNATEGGDVSVLEDGPFDCGTNVTVLATPDTDYDFAYWSYENVIASLFAEYSFDIAGNITLTANFTPKVGISTKQLAGFTIYPNPVKGQLRITNYELRNGDVEIYDVTGKLVFRSNNLKVSKSNELIIDVSTFPAGVYTIRLIDKKSVSTQKFEVK
jgi:hypothetical protein